MPCVDRVPVPRRPAPVAAPTSAAALLLAAALLAGAPAAAQSRPGEPTADTASGTVADSAAADRPPARGLARLLGRVRTDDGVPVADAELALLGVPARRQGDRTVRSAADGAYRVDAVPPGQYFVRVRRLGHAPLQFSVTLARGETRTIDVELRRLPQQLSAVEIRDRSGFGTTSSWRMRDFDRRRRIGFGRFFTRDDLRRLASGSLYDGLRTQWPLALCRDAFDPFAWQGGMGGGWRNASPGRGCSVAVSVDGMMPVAVTVAGDLPLSWVEAVEVYRGGQAPIEFGFGDGGLGRNAFLVIVWTGTESADDDEDASR